MPCCFGRKLGSTLLQRWSSRVLRLSSAANVGRSLVGPRRDGAHSRMVARWGTMIAARLSQSGMRVATAHIPKRNGPLLQVEREEMVGTSIIGSMLCSCASWRHRVGLGWFGGLFMPDLLNVVDNPLGEHRFTSGRDRIPSLRTALHAVKTLGVNVVAIEATEARNIGLTPTHCIGDASRAFLAVRFATRANDGFDLPVVFKSHVTCNETSGSQSQGDLRPKANSAVQPAFDGVRHH